MKCPMPFHVRSMLFLSFLVFIFGFSYEAWSLGDVQLAERGYQTSTVELPFEGGLDFLPDGDLIGLGIVAGSLDLMRYDANGDGQPTERQTLYTSGEFLYGTFVRVSPSGETVLFAESSTNKIYRYEVSSGFASHVLTLDGIYDAAFIDENRVYLSTGFFSGEADVYLWNLAGTEPPVKILHVEGSPAGGVATDDVGTLYFAKTTLEFPAPENSNKLYRFAFAKIRGVVEINNPVLTEEDGELLAAFRSGYNVAVNAFGEIFVTDLGPDARVYRIRRDGTAAPFMSLPSGYGFFTAASWFDQHQSFEPFRKTSSRLAVLLGEFNDDFEIVSTLYLIDPAASDPFADSVVEFQIGPGPNTTNPAFNNPQRSLEAPVGGGTFNPNQSSVVTLGDGGKLTLSFDGGLDDQNQARAGLDLIGFGNSLFASGDPASRFSEPAFLEVKSDLNHNGNDVDDPWFLIEPSVLPQNLVTPYNSQALRGYFDTTPTLLLGDLDGNNVVDDPNVSAADFYTVPDRQSFAENPASFGIDLGSGGGDAADLRRAIVQVSPGVPFLNPEGRFRYIYLDSVEQVRITDAKTGDFNVGPSTAEIDAVSIAKNQIVGRTWYVSSEITSGDGSKAFPFNDIQTAIEVSQEGDVIKVLPGVYHLGASIVSKSGVSLEGNYGLWSVNYAADDTVLDGSDLAADEPAIVFDEAAPVSDQTYAVSGFHFLNCPVGIALSGQNATIDGNFFTNSRLALNLQNAGDSDYAIVIRYNVFGHVTPNGDAVAGVSLSGGNSAFIHNDFVNHANAGLVLAGDSTIYLRDNIFAANARAIEVSDSVVQLSGEFNVFSKNDQDGVVSGLENSILQDPVFAQAGLGDYRLRLGSSVLSSGFGGSDPGVYNGPKFIPHDLAIDKIRPRAPRDLIASRESGSVALVWSAHREPDFAHFNVFRASEAGGPYEKISTDGVVVQRRFHDLAASPDGHYFYYVTSVDASTNESDASNTAEIGAVGPYVLNLAVPYYLNSNNISWSGAYAAKTILDYMGSVQPVTMLYQYAVAHNLPENSVLASVDPIGLRLTLNQFRLPGYNFAVLARSTKDEVLRDMAFWISRDIPNVPVSHIPAAVSVYGSYDHWLVVNGVVADRNPHGGSDYQVVGFWFTDPDVSGIGSNTFKSAEEFKQNYLAPIASDDFYRGKYLSVLEPPEPSKAKMSFADFPSHLEARSGSEAFFATAKSSVFAFQKTTVPASLISSIQEAGRNAIEEDYLEYDESFASVFQALTAQLPYQVNGIKGDYYLVPFGQGSETRVVAVLDQVDWHLKEVAIGESRYLPVDQPNAIAKIRKKYPLLVFGLKNRPVRYELIQERQANPYDPTWQISMGEASFEVRQDGTTTLSGSSYYVRLVRSRLYQWLERLLGRYLI